MESRMSEMGVSKKRKPSERCSKSSPRCVPTADEELRGGKFSPTFTNKIAATRWQIDHNSDDDAARNSKRHFHYSLCSETLCYVYVFYDLIAILFNKIIPSVILIVSIATLILNCCSFVHYFLLNLSSFPYNIYHIFYL